MTVRSMTATQEPPIDSRCRERRSSDLGVVDVWPKRVESARRRKADLPTCKTRLEAGRELVTIGMEQTLVGTYHVF